VGLVRIFVRPPVRVRQRRVECLLVDVSHPGLPSSVDDKELEETSLKFPDGLSFHEMFGRLSEITDSVEVRAPRKYAMQNKDTFGILPYRQQPRLRQLYNAVRVKVNEWDTSLRTSHAAICVLIDRDLDLSAHPLRSTCLCVARLARTAFAQSIRDCDSSIRRTYYCLAPLADIDEDYHEDRRLQQEKDCSSYFVWERHESVRTVQDIAQQCYKKEKTLQERFAPGNESVVSWPRGGVIGPGTKPRSETVTRHNHFLFVQLVQLAAAASSSGASSTTLSILLSLIASTPLRLLHSQWKTNCRETRPR